jgi:hypothetical protein
VRIAAQSPARAVANTTSPSRSRQTRGSRGSDQRERLSEQLKGGPHNRALAELLLQDITELVQQRLRRNDDVLASAMLEEIAAGAARDECRDQHVRIQEEFHETRVNTSSSV